jgi:hypothetical protein
MRQTWEGTGIAMLGYKVADIVAVAPRTATRQRHDEEDVRAVWKWRRASGGVTVTHRCTHAWVKGTSGAAAISLRT